MPTKATSEDILTVVCDLAYVQWDPISIVAPSHVISLWSRVGDFQLKDLDRMLWDEKKLFLHWTPIASIVLTEDYPLYYSLMKRYPDSLTRSWGNHRDRARKFLAEHKALRTAVLRELKKGPLPLTQFRDYVRTKRSADAWTAGSDLSLMLFHLLMSGEVMVVGHKGNQNVWGLSDGFLPSSVEKKLLTEQEVELEAAQKAIRALGTASPREIHYYFPRGRYQQLSRTLKRLEGESLIHRVHVAELGERDERYVHREDLPLVESLDSDEWQPRVALVAPFDNLICGRGRTNRIFGFDYMHEQFLPKNKRKFGTYVLPILWGDKIIGRIDPQMDKEEQRLLVNSVHAEPGAPRDKIVASKIGEAIERMANFLGAKDVEYTTRVPTAWKSYLR
jgi:uncharacterized protein YcaQ